MTINKPQRLSQSAEDDPFGIKKLIPSPISGRYKFLSEETKRRVLRELQIEAEKRRDQVADAIAVEIREYRIRVVNDLHHISDASEVLRARQAGAAVRNAANALRRLGRDAVFEAFWPALHHDLDAPTTEEVLYETLDALAERLDEFVKSTKPRRGREPLDTLDDFITELAFIYRNATGKKAGFSAKPVGRPGSKARASHGPFVRFCEDVVAVVNPAHKGSVFDSVRRVVRGKRPPARSKNWA